MAGGLVRPYSLAYDTGGRVFPRIHVGATNSRREEGIGVEASLGADAVVDLRIDIPAQLAASPAATLEMWALAAATSGDAKVLVEWAIVDAAENPDTATLNSEGTQTVTWGAGDSDDYKKLAVALDVATFDDTAAEKILVVRLTFQTTDWTLAAASTWFPRLKVTQS